MKEITFEGKVCLLNLRSRTGLVVPADMVAWKDAVTIPIFYGGQPAGVVRSMMIRKGHVWATGIFSDPVIVKRMAKLGSMPLEPFVKVETAWNRTHRSRTRLNDRYLITSFAVATVPPWPGCTVTVA